MLIKNEWKNTKRQHVMFRRNWLNIANPINRYCIVSSKWYYASILEILDWQIKITAKIETKAATSDYALVGTFPWEYLHFVRLFQWFAQSYCGEPWLQIAGEPPRSSGSHLLSLSCQTHRTGPARTVTHVGKDDIANQNLWIYTSL